MTNFLWGWRPSLVPLTVPRPMRSSPFAMPWGCHTSRPSGSTRYRTTETSSTSASIQTSPPSAGPSWTWSTSSSGRRSLWFMTTALVRSQALPLLFLLLLFHSSCPLLIWTSYQDAVLILFLSHFHIAHNIKRFYIHFSVYFAQFSLYTLGFILHFHILSINLFDLIPKYYSYIL